MKPRLVGLTAWLLVAVLAGAALAQPESPAYSRSLYPHWIDADRDCRDTRVEVLLRDGEPGTIRFTDPRECRVELGLWRDPYTGNFVTIPRALDVDHMVPLKHAHQAGAWAWSREQRREYANYVGYRWALLAVSASANRSKGDKSPDRWRPENPAFWCQYAQAWATVKFVFGLSSTDAERTAVKEMLQTC